jgi:hypothetical protein
MKKRLSVIVVVSLLAVVVQVAQAQTRNRYALLIGNAAYTSIGRLKNPVNDANDMAETLRGLGFQVDLVLDGDLGLMEDAAIRLKNRLSTDRNAYGFFFYAGHGVQSNGENYLIPVDADIRSESLLRQRAMAVSFLMDELNAAHNELNLIVLDACRDNPFSWARSGSRGLQVMGNQPADSIIVYATSAGSTALDGEGRNGLFTSHLLNNLKTPGLEINEVFRMTMGDVARASNNAQRPAIYSQFAGLAYLGTQPAQSVPVQPAPSDWTDASEFELELGENGVTITGYKGEATTVNIPAVIDGSPVAAIGDGAFTYCSGLRSITIPNSVTYIGEKAFEDCSGLRSITIPNSVTYIGGWAFWGCSELTSITIPASVTYMGIAAFALCSGLTSITVDAMNTRYSSVNGILFSKDGKTLVWYPKGKMYTSYIIPNGVTEIGICAFAGCSGLLSIAIPNSVTTIGQEAFEDCSGLILIAIPNSVTSIKGFAFQRCSGLTSVTIPNSVTEIGGWAFSYCGGLTSISIPTSVTEIGEYTFCDCSGLTSISIPTSVTAIGAYAFRGCNGLTSISIPTSVTAIGDWAFEGCSGLSAASRDAIRERFGDGVF